MVRVGTRSQTGNAKPRVFQTVDTEPSIKRAVKPKATAAKTSVTKSVGAKPTGVTKRKAPAKKAGAATKAKATVTKAATKAKKATKPKTAAK